MYAIVEIAGQQFKVTKGRRINVHRLPQAEGDQVEFDNILLTDDGTNINVGTPKVAGSKVTAQVLTHFKGEKVPVFKKKKRKGYQKWNNHRQYYSQILVQEIIF